jgi:hypothetical protein
MARAPASSQQAPPVGPQVSEDGSIAHPHPRKPTGAMIYTVVKGASLFPSFAFPFFHKPSEDADRPQDCSTAR